MTRYGFAQKIDIMRKTLFLLFLVCPMFAHAQQAVCIIYDNAGNRTARFICGAGLTDPGGDSAEALLPEAAERSADLSPLTGQIVPNPNDGRFDLVLGQPVENGHFELYGATGDIVLRQAASGERHAFYLRDLPPGNYYLVLKSAGQVLGRWIALKH